MSGIKDLIQSVSPKAIAEGVIGKFTDSAKDIITNVQDNKLTIEQGLQRLEELKMEYQITLEEEISERWENDSKSGYWLPANIRPLALAWALVNATLLIYFDSADWIDVEEKWIPMLTQLILTIVGGYFALRSMFDKAKESPTDKVKRFWGRKK